VNPFVRASAPVCLVANTQRWTEDWVGRVESATSQSRARFSIPASCDSEVRGTLALQTAKHCAFCDRWPLDPLEIEHLRPKIAFPTHAFEWSNLYGSCRGCNGAKRERFDEDVLRADDPSYTFDRFFEISSTYELQPNPAASAADQRRACVTIDLYKLNRSALIQARKHRVGDPRADVGEFRYLFPIV
jgi:uncharacterized protein (TIGR02646 family)